MAEHNSMNISICRVKDEMDLNMYSLISIGRSGGLEEFSNISFNFSPNVKM